jgi:hypothetical protein
MGTARLTGEIGSAPADRAADLPPAKAALARAIAAVNRAQEDLEATQRPVDKIAHARAAAVLGEAAELRSEIARLGAVHEADINAWGSMQAVMGEGPRRRRNWCLWNGLSAV